MVRDPFGDTFGEQAQKTCITMCAHGDQVSFVMFQISVDARLYRHFVIHVHGEILEFGKTLQKLSNGV